MSAVTETNLKAAPLPFMPLRAIVTTSDGYARAVFNSRDDARQFLNHPGHLPVMAAHYLSWTNQQ